MSDKDFPQDSGSDVNDDLSPEDIRLEGEFHFELPEEHEPAIKILWEEMEGRREVMRLAQDEWIEARNAMWEKIYEVLGVDRTNPKFAKLLYKPQLGIVIKNGQTHSSLIRENEQLRDMNSELAAALDAKMKMIHERRFEGAAAARDIEKTLRSFLGEFRGVDELLAKVTDLTERVCELEGADPLDNEQECGECGGQIVGEPWHSKQYQDKEVYCSGECAKRATNDAPEFCPRCKKDGHIILLDFSADQWMCTECDHEFCTRDKQGDEDAKDS